MACPGLAVDLQKKFIKVSCFSRFDATSTQLIGILLAELPGHCPAVS